MSEDKGKITVYYDGACPSCVRDRRYYEKLAGKSSEQVCWFGITGWEDQLRQIGIDRNFSLIPGNYVV
jgi:predicted DCC family thiol-disulfide oxidoreductase YuxK